MSNFVKRLRLYKREFWMNSLQKMPWYLTNSKTQKIKLKMQQEGQVDNAPSEIKPP